MNNKLSVQIELLIDNIIQEMKCNEVEVTTPGVMEVLMSLKDMERKPKAIIRKIVDKIMADYFQKKFII